MASEGYFDSVAGEWDKILAGYYGEELLSAFLARMGLESSMVVADVGAGTGFLTAPGQRPAVRTRLSAFSSPRA